MAILCCRVCKSTPIIFISASFVPSNLWLEHHHLTRRVVRPTSLCHQTGRFLLFSHSWLEGVDGLSVNVPSVPQFSSPSFPSALSSLPTVTQTLFIEGYQVRQNTLQFLSTGVTYTSLGPTK